MVRFTVGGVPWEEITEEKKLAIRNRATNIVAEIVTQEVQNMIDAGKSKEEIDKFLGLNQKYKN